MLNLFSRLREIQKVHVVPRNFNFPVSWIPASMPGRRAFFEFRANDYLKTLIIENKAAPVYYFDFIHLYNMMPKSILYIKLKTKLSGI